MSGAAELVGSAGPSLSGMSVLSRSDAIEPNTHTHTHTHTHINWRYAECGEAIHDADSDPVRAALNSPAIDLAQCDKDLRMRRWAAGAGGAAAGAGGDEDRCALCDE